MVVNDDEVLLAPQLNAQWQVLDDLVLAVADFADVLVLLNQVDVSNFIGPVNALPELLTSKTATYSCTMRNDEEHQQEYN